MNTINRKKLAVGTVLGLSATLGIMNPVLAAPRDNDNRRERRDVAEARRDLEREKQELRNADSRQEKREERRDVQRAKQELKEERQDLRRERRDDHWDNRRDDRGDWRRDGRHDNRRDDHWDNRRSNRNDGNWNNRPGYRPNYNYGNGGYGYGNGGYNYGYGNGGYNGSYGNGGYGNSNVDFRGTVLENTSRGDEFRVRGDNGRIYTVTYSRDSFRSGQRIKIVGYVQGGIIVATDINRL